MCGIEGTAMQHTVLACSVRYVTSHWTEQLHKKLSNYCLRYIFIVSVKSQSWCTFCYEAW